jgi:3-methyl-2-oxobutanoate hydroxymethyltransferase
MPKKLSRMDLQRMKEKNQKVVWVTSYDYWTAQFAENAGMEMILVGDSLGMCIYGYEGTIPVTMDQCIYHSEAVRRGASNTFIIGDMPFLSYQVSVEEAVRNAGRFFKEAKVDAIKLEGGRRVVPQIRAIADGGMLVMGHIGLTPQSSGQLGGFKAQGRTCETAFDLIDDAKAIEKAGAFALLVEAVPPEVCKIMRDSLSIPVYSIGKKYANLGQATYDALKAYYEDVKNNKFPEDQHTYNMVEGEQQKLENELRRRKS